MKHHWTIAREKDRAAFKRLHRFVCGLKIDASEKQLRDDIELMKRMLKNAEEEMRLNNAPPS